MDVRVPGAAPRALASAPMSFTALIVTADADLARTAGEILAQARAELRSCPDSVEALRALDDHAPDLVLLDAALPDGALALCRKLRNAPTTAQVPLIALVPEGDRTRLVTMLDAGADDCAGKPLHDDELLARINALRRRAATALHKGRLKAGGVEMDLDRWRVTVAGDVIELTRKEFHLLQMLLEARGRVLTRDALLARVWPHGSVHGLDTRTVDVHVGRLRRKLGPVARHIITVRNVGFRYDVAPEWLRRAAGTADR